MWKLALVLGGVAAFLTAPGVASGQDIEAKLGNSTTARFVVKDSNNMEILVLEAKDQTTESPNIIGGHEENSVTSGVYGATISGGGEIELRQYGHGRRRYGGGRTRQPGW